MTAQISARLWSAAFYAALDFSITLARTLTRPVSFLSLLIFILPAHAANTHNRAIIRDIRSGSAELSTDKGKSWKKANLGSVLAANCALRTDTNGVIDLFLGQNGPVLRLAPNTTLGIDRLDINSKHEENVIDTQLDLKEGRIYGHVQKLASKSKYEIKTPLGVAGIRGTNSTEFSTSSVLDAEVVQGGVMIVVGIINVPPPPITVAANQQLPGLLVNGFQLASVISLPPDHPVRAECATLLEGISFNPDGSITAKFKNPSSPGGTITAPAKGPLPAPPPGTIWAFKQTSSPNEVHFVTKPAHTF